MKTRYRDILLGAAGGAAAVFAFMSSGVADGASEWARLLPFSQQNLLIMRQARSIIEQYHVDESKLPNESKLFFGSMKGMVSAVDDPYTRYVEPEQLREENMEMEGEYGGLGMYVGQRDGKILVISPIEDTPAYRAGVKPMDEIVKVDEKVVLGMPQDEVVKLLRGAPDTDVTVMMRRTGEDELKSFTMTREIINIKTVRHEMIETDKRKIAYVRLNNFHQKSAVELEAALKQEMANGAEGVILDMRNNPGGLLNVAVDVASLFLDGGLVVSINGRVSRFDDAMHAERGKAIDLPTVVMINEGSASASEIVAGAIQDRKRGPLVGMKSYGKGSVQSLFNLPDQSGMFVTIAKYATPSGKIIDQKGLTPDHVISGDIISDDIKEDPQLQKALSVMKNTLLSPQASAGKR